MGARITCVVSLYFSLLAWQCQAQNLRVAVASNFRPALEQLAPIFFAQSQIVLTLSSGASGQLVAQIQQGAPFDVFLELVAVLNLIPSTTFSFEGGLGIRYFFKTD